MAFSRSCLLVAGALMAASVAQGSPREECSDPSCSLRSAIGVGVEEVSVLMASDAAITGDLAQFSHGDRVHRLWLDGWRSTDDQLLWEVDVQEEGEYVARVLACSHCKMASGYSGGSSPVPVTLTAVSCDEPHESAWSSVKGTIAFHDFPNMQQWSRHNLTSTLSLPAGRACIVLRATSFPEEGELNLAVLSVEVCEQESLPC